MKDFYAHLVLPPDAPVEAIREALPNVAPDVRQAAELILFDPRRRAVYDRNHRLLTMIGELRMHLGLNYSRFWARQEYKEFWRELALPAGKPRGRRVDSMLIANAFRAAKRHGRKHATQKHSWLVAAILVLLALLAVFLWARLR